MVGSTGRAHFETFGTSTPKDTWPCSRVALTAGLSLLDEPGADDQFPWHGGAGGVPCRRRKLLEGGGSLAESGHRPGHTHWRGAHCSQPTDRLRRHDIEQPPPRLSPQNPDSGAGEWSEYYEEKALNLPPWLGGEFLSGRREAKPVQQFRCILIATRLEYVMSVINEKPDVPGFSLNTTARISRHRGRSPMLGE